MLAERRRKAEDELKALSIFLSENGQERLAGGSGDEEGTERLASVFMWSLAFCAEFPGFPRLFSIFSSRFARFSKFFQHFFRPVAAYCGRRNFFLCDFCVTAGSPAAP